MTIKRVVSWLRKTFGTRKHQGIFADTFEYSVYSPFQLYFNITVLTSTSTHTLYTNTLDLPLYGTKAQKNSSQNGTHAAVTSSLMTSPLPPPFPLPLPFSTPSAMARLAMELRLEAALSHSRTLRVSPPEDCCCCCCRRRLIIIHKIVRYYGSGLHNKSPIRANLHYVTQPCDSRSMTI